MEKRKLTKEEFRHRVLRDQKNRKHPTRRRAFISCLITEGGYQKNLASSAAMHLGKGVSSWI